jgi:hypothetical protein
MRAIFLICCILVLALLGLSYTPGTSLEISVTEVDNGVIIQNVGNVACLVFVNSLEGEQQFELAVGTGVTVSDITKPIEVSAVSPTTGWVDWERVMEKWMETKYKLSSNFTGLASATITITMYAVADE